MKKEVKGLEILAAVVVFIIYRTSIIEKKMCRNPKVLFVKIRKKEHYKKPNQNDQKGRNGLT